jgi:hypothetical protein
MVTETPRLYHCESNRHASGRVPERVRWCSNRASGKRLPAARISFAKHPPCVLLAHFVGNAGPRKSHELGERRVRPARPARQRRNKAGHGSIRMAVECPQIDRIDGPTRRAANPQKPIASGNGGADGRREQHWHSLGLSFVPNGDQALGVFKHLGVRRAPDSGLSLGSTATKRVGRTRRAFSDDSRTALRHDLPRPAIVAD